MLTSITAEQVTKLEEIFAVLTPEGWKFPAWLDYLRDVVTTRDYYAGVGTL